MITEEDKQFIKGTLQELVVVKIAKIEAELDGMWEHIHNLEEKLLAPTEMPKK